MRTFSIATLGCKVNQYESQQIRELLERQGLIQVYLTDRSNPAVNGRVSLDQKSYNSNSLKWLRRNSGRRHALNNPDLVVVNTCCVTHKASAKSRQYIRKTQKRNPNAIIVVAGCLPIVQIGELGGLGENIHRGNIYLIRNRDQLGAALSQIVNGKIAAPNVRNTLPGIKNNDLDGKICASEAKNIVSITKNAGELSSFMGHTRAFLKVQDGCDGCCSYCIVPKARPDIKSKPIEKVLEEACRLVESGHKEIVVTGVFLGAYGQDTVRRNKWPGRHNDKLAELLDKMAEIGGLERVRLSSLEPGDVSKGLLEVFCRHRNIMPHLHLSLQSGSSSVLKRMCRQYTAGEFLEKVALIKQRLDRPALTTDLIVGFPGETDADFEKTVDLAKSVGFAKMHVFSFSPRKGTAAASMQDTVDTEVMKKRSLILRDLNVELGYEFRQQFIGEEDVILTENGAVAAGSGRSERYFTVSLEKGDYSVKNNELVRVKLVENGKDGMIGRCIVND